MTVLAKNVLIRFSCQVTVDLTHSQKQALFKRMRTSNQKLLLIFLNFHLIRIQIHYLHLDRKRRFLIFKFLNLWFTHFPLTPLQGFKNKPKVFITVQHKHTDRPYDSMNLWLENVSKNKFNVCMREFMAFDGIHSDLKVVRWLSKILR